jgi:hypothetical protein
MTGATSGVARALQPIPGGLHLVELSGRQGRIEGQAAPLLLLLQLLRGEHWRQQLQGHGGSKKKRVVE